MDIYQQIYDTYVSETPEQRQAHRQHYEQAHQKNVAANRRDLFVMTRKILAAFDKADQGLPY